MERRHAYRARMMSSWSEAGQSRDSPWHHEPLATSSRNILQSLGIVATGGYVRRRAADDAAQMRWRLWTVSIPAQVHIPRCPQRLRRHGGVLDPAWEKACRRSGRARMVCEALRAARASGSPLALNEEKHCMNPSPVLQAQLHGPANLKSMTSRQLRPAPASLLRQLRLLLACANA